MKQIRKIDLMHKLFGNADSGICKNCQHFQKYCHHDKTYSKCKVYGVTNSEASDWRGKYPACGLYPDNPYEGDKEIISLRFEEQAQETPGQMNLFNFMEVGL